MNQSRWTGILPSMSNRRTTSPVIGIVGAGQLARMTLQAAIPLGAADQAARHTERRTAPRWSLPTSRLVPLTH